MSSYHQLSIEERCSIARLREAGQSIRQIAAAMDRQPSTISRELTRNSGSQLGYQPGYAQQQANARRWSGSRLERDDALRENILDRLADGWSPEQVCGRLALGAGHKVISHETIYRFIHAQMKRTNDCSWRRYLPRGKLKRGWRNKGGGAPIFTGRKSIHDRPAAARDRTDAGHWEADTMLFATPGQAVLVAHERQSRLTIVLRATSLKAEPTARTLTRLLGPMPPNMRQTITFDNGTEFARHYRITQQIGVDTFFCDVRSPWQKGGVENAIGRLRRAVAPQNHSTPSPTTPSTPSPENTIIPRANASASKPQPRHSSNRCTSNVNLHPEQVRDDWIGYMFDGNNPRTSSR